MNLQKQNLLISLKNITKIYNTNGLSFQALDTVNLVIERGEYLAILGPSGSGKSTLMQIMGCLSTPTSGNYKLDGEEISQCAPDELAKIRNKKIGFVFQSFNLLAHMDIVENVALPLVYVGMGEKERLEKARAVLTELGLASHFKHHPNELSGGQKQRVAIARALVTEPDIILADEPTGNLDTKSGSDVIALFEQFSSQGKTIIVVTHDVNIANRTRRIIRLRDGKIVVEER